MKSAIALRRKLQDPKPVLGLLVSGLLSFELIETAMQSGVDYLIIDGEHMDHGGQRIADACLLGRVADFPILLRPARSDAQSISIAMDLGPCGLLLPMIETAEQLNAVRDGLYMPPRGRRRPGGPANRWLKRFDYATFKSEIEDHVIVIPQVESPRGLINAAELAGHPITTALGVGPFDLSASMGMCSTPVHPDVRAAISKLRVAAEAAGKPMWMIGEPTQLVAEGFRFICMGDPVGLLQNTLTKLVNTVRTNGSHAPLPANNEATERRLPVTTTVYAVSQSVSTGREETGVEA